MNDPINRADRPDDLRSLFVELAAAGDADALAGLYEPGAIMAFPPGRLTEGREAIRAIWGAVIEGGVPITLEPAMPTVVCGSIALTGTVRADGIGVRVQVVRRQPDGSWLRVIDVPEMAPRLPTPTGEGSRS